MDDASLEKLTPSLLGKAIKITPQSGNDECFHLIIPDLLRVSEPLILSLFSGERPNTYTYTKAIAEHLIAEEGAKELDPSQRIPMAVGLYRLPVACFFTFAMPFTAIYSPTFTF